MKDPVPAEPIIYRPGRVLSSERIALNATGIFCNHNDVN